MRNLSTSSPFLLPNRYNGEQIDFHAPGASCGFPETSMVPALTAFFYFRALSNIYLPLPIKCAIYQALRISFSATDIMGNKSIFMLRVRPAAFPRPQWYLLLRHSFIFAHLVIFIYRCQLNAQSINLLAFPPPQQI